MLPSPAYSTYYNCLEINEITVQFPDWIRHHFIEAECHFLNKLYSVSE